jgi:CHAD domain-containing protein
LAPPDLARPKPLRKKSTVGDLVQASITASVHRLLDHDSLIRVSEDPEAIHQARVATRRLRSDLRTFRPVIDRTWSEPLREELKWFGEQLGRVRDADVLSELLISKAVGVPAARREEAGLLIDRLREMRERDREQLLEAMRSARYADLLERLVDAAQAPRLRKGCRGTLAARVADSLTRRPAKRLRRTVKRLPKHAPDTDLHEVRKRAKQARYALEAVAPIVGGGAKRTAKRLADLQDVLGDHQDAVVAAAWLEAAARDSADVSTAFVAGEIAGAFAADRHRLRNEWPKTWKPIAF